ncbi:M28 family peptidase [Desulfocurvus vexinensis]|uniref:M28 family peptidase n=1 Tax=Desulfocurvus vexinensis TaxID=399548 RepID=UPI00048C0607|nr:M28 family peptidase [Desulfocurvus vexinensis]
MRNPASPLGAPAPRRRAPRLWAAPALALLLALALPAAAPARQGAPEAVPGLRASLERTVHELAVGIGPRHQGAPRAYARAARRITALLERWGVPYETFPVPAAPAAPPVIIAHPGGPAPAPAQPVLDMAPPPPLPPLLLGTHYDTVPGSPGAADNASGVAILLETARLLHRPPRAKAGPAPQPPPPGAVCVAFFPNEEESHFLTPASGSVAYAALLAARGLPPGRVVAVDCVGLGPRAQATGILAALFGPGVAVGAREASAPLARDLAAALAARQPVDTVVTDSGGAWIDRSDHAAFIPHGWQGALLTSPGVALAACVHAPCDTPANLDFQILENAVLGLVDFAARGPRGPRPPAPAPGP